MRKIKIDNAGHVYLNDYDIGQFVAGYELDGEQLIVKLVGDIEMPKKPRKKKKVKHD